MENIGLGLLLMVVGMATVFVILLIIIWLRADCFGQQGCS